MIFQSEKKKDLWRYASKNNPSVRDGVPSAAADRPPRLPLPQPRHRPRHQSFGCSSEEDTLAMRQTPPPPYSSMPCAMDCSGSYCHNLIQSSNHHHHNNNNNNHSYRLPNLPNPMEAPPTPSCESMSIGENSDYCSTAPGCSCANSGDVMLIDESDRERDRERDWSVVFRNCWRCAAGATDSISDSSSTIPAANARASQLAPSQCRFQSQAPVPLQPQSIRARREDFEGLMKMLKRKQMADLLLAVKSRVDVPTRPAVNATTGTPARTTTPTYLQCILITKTLSAAREQHVTASRLFFWSNLWSGEELKRLPACHSANDEVYMCCNPLHWCRILTPSETDSQPPPYQRSKMQRLKGADSEEDSQNDAKSTTALSTWSSSISSIFKRPEQPSLLESFTTDGKDRNINAKGWCQIAYWELAHRVGEFFQARTTAVNVYTEGIVDCGGDSMCLSDLSAAGGQDHSDEVQKTRQKVGLGVTLSLEGDNVWIYNRGNVPIFVGSPTLAERQDRVCKVLPGYCLKAFETIKAQKLSMRQHGHHHPHMGPIDWFSLKISFAKGWGQSYRRQDIMGCPCWLDVHFSHLR
ncbi:hypothetical protein KR018_002157 [Drosophila ironensis]|nr:hypothetical protein KR018_002157 [Drosophila ironensis]